MKTDEIWLIEYDDDPTFGERLEEAQDIMNRYCVLNGSGYLEICKDKNIPAGRKDDIVVDKNRKVKNYFKVPFYK